MAEQAAVLWTKCRHYNNAHKVAATYCRSPQKRMYGSDVKTDIGVSEREKEGKRK